MPAAASRKTGRRGPKRDAVVSALRGAAEEGGLTSADIAEQCRIPRRQASAWLYTLARRGTAVLVDHQEVPRDGAGGELKPLRYGVFVLADERHLYEMEEVS